MPDVPRWHVTGEAAAKRGPAASTYGKAVTDKADAFGFKWNRTGRSSKHIGFDWSGPDA
jgi:hypothetical protein